MKDTGIIRRIDGLGRIVIPKEIRKNIKIKEGDPIEFYTDRGELILKKYSPLEDNAEFLSSVVIALSQVLEKDCLILNTEKIISTTAPYKDLEGKSISDGLMVVLNDKKSALISLVDNGNEFAVVKGEQQFNADSVFILPIFNESKVFGGIIIPTDNKDVKEDSLDFRSVRVCAKIIAEYFNFE